MIPLWLGLAALSNPANAAGLHTGIPVSGVAGVGEASFLTPETGWTASVPGGWTRVFVGATEAAGAEWYARALESLQVTPAELPGFDADQARGDGDTLVVFRDGNVAVMVRADHDAGALARRLHDAIVDGGPAPSAARLIATGERWAVQASGVVATQAKGGQVVPNQPGVYSRLPDEVVVWDAFGRATVVRP